MILFLLFGFSLSSQNNLITNSSFDTAIGDYAEINGASDEWFTINGDPNIAQTAGTIHLKSNNSANAIVRYKLDPTKFTAGKSYKLLFDAIALGIDTDLTKGLTFQVRKASGTGNNNSNVYFWYEADSQTGICSINGALYTASVNKGQAVSSWGTPRPWSSRGGANFTIPAGTDLSVDPMILTFLYNKETNAPADAASGWYLDNVSITEIPADPDGVIVEDGSMDSHNRRKTSPMPYTTNFWIQSTGAVQVFADRDADNNITQTAVMVAAKGSAGGSGIARKLINNLTVNTDYVLKFKIKATEGKTYTKGANIRMKTNNANGNNLDALSTSITVADFNGAASDPAVDFIQKEHAFNSLNNTELVINFYHGNETDAAFDGTYVYLDDFIVEEAAAADTTPPVITLVGDNPVNITVGDTYSDAGATATDDVDGDITANIVVGGDIVDVNNAAQYIITYNVSDAAGNAAAEVTRTVNVNDPVDTTPPDITLIGDAVVELNVGDTYNEEGATATDNVDGDISANIVIGGDTVDTNTAGQYIVTYNVSDAAMNAATEVTRTVNVNEEVEPCANANATAQPAADFDNDSVDIRLWKEDSSSYEIVDGASETSLAGNTVGGTGNIMKYIDTGGQYANVQMVTCAKFDLENSHGKFTLKAYIDSGSLTGGSPNQLELKLQNSELGGDAWATQVGIIKAIDQLDTWVELEFDFSLDGATVARTDLDQVVIQFNSENNNDNVTAYLDDIATSVGAGPIAEPEPATAAPSPDEDATTDNVVSILSAHYAPFRDITNNNLDPWGDAEWSSLELNGETLWRYENLNYQGHDIGTWDGMTLVDGADVSASTHVHFDAWTENGDVVDFYILDFDDGTGNEAFTSVTTTAGAWSEHEVKLDDFNTIEAFDGTLRQLKITRNEANNAANISYLYLTNIYFYTDQPLTTVDRNLGALKVFPNPTQNQWTIQAEKNIESVRVFDVLGKEVMHVKPFSNAVNIDASKLRDGVYFASINDVKTVKIIKQ
tara:strand:+ start:180 stop:3203 length:3024 start_codon:yes stop_codon:yes gene_type:complete